MRHMARGASFRRSRAVVLVLAGCCTAGACASKPVPAGAPPPAAPQPERLQESLFKGDQAVLSNQEIERILSGRVTIADRHRLAVLSLSARTHWLQTIADAEAENADRFLEALRSSPQLTQVRFMPSLLIPERRTIPYLREAAARFQADLLFIYTTRVQTFRQNRLVGADEVRARCVGESVLLDVRTGVVVHTAKAAESISVRRTSADLNFEETVAKAEADAAGKALMALAAMTTSYLADPAKQ